MNIILYTYIIPRKIYRLISQIASHLITVYKFKVFSVAYMDFHTNGIPVIDLYDGATLLIGKKFRMNNGAFHNMIGRQQNCYFVASNNGRIKIGDNVAISGTAIHCNKAITIGDNVRIGGNTVIYDTDFHSLNFFERTQIPENFQNVKQKEVIVCDNVFIGAHCTILKGVQIGKNSIIGAGSVVTKNIPPNEIWAGNPAKFISSVNGVN